MAGPPLQKRLADVVDLLGLGIGGSSVLGANVGGEIFVTLGLVLLLHFLQGFGNNRTGRLKHPFTLGAAVALKVLALDPYQLAGHGPEYTPVPCPKQNTL